MTLLQRKKQRRYRRSREKKNFASIQGRKEEGRGILEQKMTGHARLYPAEKKEERKEELQGTPGEGESSLLMTRKIGDRGDTPLPGCEKKRRKISFRRTGGGGGKVRGSKS